MSQEGKPQPIVDSPFWLDQDDEEALVLQKLGNNLPAKLAFCDGTLSSRLQRVIITSQMTRQSLVHRFADVSRRGITSEPSNREKSKLKAWPKAIALNDDYLDDLHWDR